MARTSTSSGPEILVEIHRDGDGGPLHRQLEQGLRAAIGSGRLGAGAVLPSSRMFSTQLGVARTVVVEAYEQLVAEGYLVTRRGGSTRVSPRVSGSSGSPATLGTTPIEYRIDFAYGNPDVAEFPRAAWLRSLRRVLADAPSDRLSYLDPNGAPELRDALAAYLNRVRGTTANAGRIVICNGFAQGMSLATEMLAANGATRLATEDPGQLDAPGAARRFGLETVPIPVDGEGLDVSFLERTDADAVVITPAHHFPTGAVLSARRRAALLAWSGQRNRLIIEDDYDAEYRYDREPIGAMQGLAPEHVIYAGSASKTLAPGLRLGWLIAPADLVGQLGAIKMANDRGSASLEQLALADFLTRGDFDRHLRRMRAIYRDRREVLLGALRRYAPDLQAAGASAGLHVVAWLPDGLDEADVVGRAADVGVRVAGVARYRLGSGDQRGGLLFGYGTLGSTDIEQGVRLVAEATAAARAGARH
ncbi:MAG: MocR-like pyridoxine biosynthesis transcription factor PdxR [Candidatus Limnocylindrales bacterium]